MSESAHQRVRRGRWVMSFVFAVLVGILGVRALRTAQGNDVSAAGVLLRDHLDKGEDYELDDLELARQAGPDALPLLEGTLRLRGSVTYERGFDWMSRRLQSLRLTSVLKYFPQPERAAEQKRAVAARMLEALGPDAAPAAGALGRALDDESALVRWCASLALLRLGGHETEVILARRRWLTNEIKASAYVLARVGPPARSQLPLLIPILAGNTNDSELSGAICLPWILTTRPVIPPAHSLGEMLQRSSRAADDAETWKAIDAATAIMMAEFRREMGSRAGNSNAVVQPTHIGGGEELAVVMMGPLASDLAPVLAAQLTSSNASDRFAAGLAWWHVTGDGEGSARAMGSGRSMDQENSVNDKIAQLAFLLTLNDVGTNAAPAVHQAAAFLDDPNPLFRRLAARSIGQCGGAGEFAVLRLERCLNDDYAGVRLDAAEALWNLTHTGRRLTPVLSALLEERSPRRRGQAARLLRIMGGAEVGAEVLERARAVSSVAQDPFPSVFEVLMRMTCRPP